MKQILILSQSFLIISHILCQIKDGGVFLNDAPVSNTTDDSNDRIINGVGAAQGQFKYQAGIFLDLNGNRQFCGGALISNQWILTAAHCVYNARNFLVILGATHAYDNQAGKITRGLTKALYHPSYNQSNLNYDVAVAKLSAPVQFSDKIAAIRLPTYAQYLNPGIDVVASGWGKANDRDTLIRPNLSYVNLKTISNKECKSYYVASLVLDNVVCCDGRSYHGTCQGDSGGPLVQQIDGVYTHVGIVSFVASRGCATGYPSGFARTNAFLDFIYANTDGVPRW